MPATAVCVRPEALELLAMKGGDAVTPEGLGEAVINQWGKIPPEEGPSHFGSWRPPPGETRPAKRRDELSQGGKQVRSPQHHAKPAAPSLSPGKPDQGGAEPRHTGRRPRTAPRPWTRSAQE